MSLEFISNEHMLFPTPLWQVQIKGVDNDAIKKYVYHLRDTTEGVVISNRGGWHSKDILEPIPEALENLFSNLQSFVNQYCAQITGLNQLKIGNFWFNINKPGNYNKLHNHRGSLISGVFYIDTPKDCGNISFERYDDTQYYLPENLEKRTVITGSAVSFEAEKGVLLLFPSWLLHQVEPSQSQTPRISMSFNYNMKDE